MKKRKVIWLAGLLCLAVSAGLCACGSSAGNASDTAAETGETAAAGNIDIVEAVEENVQARDALSNSIKDEDAADSYKEILNSSDAAGGYYLQDVNGDGVPELIVGEETMTVYTYDSGIKTLGTIEGQDVHYSDTYGIITEYESGTGEYELRSYKYSDGLLQKTVLVSSTDTDEYSSEAASFLSSAQALTKFDLSDFSVFGG